MTKLSAITRPGPTASNPKPLALHMSLQALTWLSALSAFPHWRNGSLSLNARNGKNLRASDLLPPGLNTEDLVGAITREAFQRLQRFSDGIKNYQNYPRHPRPPEPPAIWASGSTRLLDYGIFTVASSAPPVLVIPSLINRAYILDLAPDRSLIRHLAASGLRPLLVDWGRPEEIERDFGLDQYIGERLQAVLDFVSAETSRRPALTGYCMGGNLALALAGRNPGAISALALLATPWDFHSDGGVTARFLDMTGPALKHLIAQMGVLPVDMLQAMFAGLDPAQTGSKFRHFATATKDSDAAKRFILLEDWVNDGVPLPGKVALECLFGWYRDNTPYTGNWKIAGETVDPTKITLPTFAAIPSKDHIVPPASAQALADILPNVHILNPPAGHIGMVAGSQAEQRLYEPLSQWLTEQIPNK